MARGQFELKLSQRDHAVLARLLWVIESYPKVSDALKGSGFSDEDREVLTYLHQELTRWES